MRLLDPVDRTTSKLISMAASLAGSNDAVREVMRASEKDFALYQSGEREAPADEFTRLLGLILKKQSEEIQRFRSRLRSSRAGRA